MASSASRAIEPITGYTPEELYRDSDRSEVLTTLHNLRQQGEHRDRCEWFCSLTRRLWMWRSTTLLSAT